MEDRFALLIDADNVSAKYIKPILDELSKYGNVTYKRIYGDWTKTNNASWKEELLQNSITPIQQFSYTTGKNATDSAMIIDARLPFISAAPRTPWTCFTRASWKDSAWCPVTVTLRSWRAG